MHFTALGQGRKNACNQPMDVKQWHDIETAIVGSELRAGSDVLSRGTHISLGQRHDFGSRGGARCVQHQRDVIRQGLASECADR